MSLPSEPTTQPSRTQNLSITLNTISEYTPLNMSHCYTFAPACVRLFSAASIKDGNTIKKSTKPKRSVPL